ncbi:MAG: hypothetical protein M1812_005976 [Candelaria pacifica]|nr:MAG: hypothetical protein M1812_005976 [Candelaria pacifica]
MTKDNKASHVKFEANLDSSSSTSLDDIPNKHYISTPQRSTSNSSSRLSSRLPSPLISPTSRILRRDEKTNGHLTAKLDKEADYDSESDRDDGDEDDDMSGPRPPLHRPTDGRSHQPLLNDDRGRPSYDSPRPPLMTRKSQMSTRSPDTAAKSETRTKYTYAGWLTHGSWSLLWPVQLLILRIQKRKMPWKVFWRRHINIIRTTAQMVVTQDLHPSSRLAQKSPVPYILKMTAFVTTALTVAGGSWYVAVNLTSASDLTAIYNCSAFFAYAFSVPLLKEKLRFDKIFSVLVAILGVLVVAYGDAAPTKHGGKSGGAVGGGPKEGEDEANNRALGNLVIGVGSVMYGLYEVMYKKLACPPEGTSPGRGMIFANTFGSLIGCFTFFILWIPLPFLHFLGWERFELPHGRAAWMLAISVLANATFSGCFLVLISLTSPVLSSVAALLTIFLVAIVDWVRTGQPLSAAAIAGGILIIAAFLLLSWSTYREMDEERRKKLQDELESSDSD